MLIWLLGQGGWAVCQSQQRVVARGHQCFLAVVFGICPVLEQSVRARLPDCKFGLAALLNQLVLQVLYEAALLVLAALKQGGHVDALLHESVGEQKGLLQLHFCELFV